MFRFFSFIGLLIGAFVLPWWMVVPLFVLYAFRFLYSVELIVIAFCLDAYFGVAMPWLPVPVFYTSIAIFILIILTFVKPYLSWYEQQY